MPSDEIGFSRRIFEAPFGVVTVVGSDLGIRFVMFDNDAHPKPLEKLRISDTEIHDSVNSAITQLKEYFEGSRRDFELSLDLQGTEFQVAAWNALAEIPYGRTASYGQQAASIGRPKAVRAIGGANGRNPVAIVLPCHRIVGADGSLTGFGGGIAVKKWLLDHEHTMLHSATSNPA
ncbi:MAG: methylated-DNA--[protein]-cysteine S-methyltransferase [Actinobacteria bacterium]|uniref:methylated-DNA--[protein]-cysteine S-methyltransferase n=1 Tax=freshwater metagenome TaxID=449393 RepID=A0A6J7TK24_9ZZZZ|nr:methylated-DNA--[protein]-cysteine S-methyltransferase [Actinomycetota bacterium]